MIVYHGSGKVIVRPDLVHSRKNVDFGIGFYVTSIFEQAEKWSLKFKDKGGNAVVSSYVLDEEAFDAYKVLSFDAYSGEWLDFILNCRRGTDTSDYDIVMGGVANDRVFNTVELYFDGLIDEYEAIRRLRYEEPNMQIALRSQRVMDNCLHFKGSKTI